MKFELFFLAPLLAAASNVVDLTAKNFDDVVLKSGKPAMIEFFAPWCGHCKKLAPIWEELADSYVSKKDAITIAKVDCDANKPLCGRFGIGGYPTLKYFDGKSDTPLPYDKQRDVGSLQTFIGTQSSVKPKVKKELPSKVVVLNEANFDSVVGGEKNVLVEFYAPWCGHCKTLAPIYEQLANTFAADAADLVIAKVDADAPTGKAPAKKYGVSGFPTLKFFPKGSSEAVDYNGGRNEAAFIEFLNKNAGTFRLPGGALNEHAGVIPTFTEAIEKMVKGDVKSLANVTEEIKKLAAEAKDKSAAVYVKTLEKLAKNEGYVQKEVERLQKILSKGGLVEEKRDELTVKKNVLLSFLKEKKEQTEEVVEEKMEQAGEVLEETKEKAGEKMEQAGEAAKEKKEQTEEFLGEKKEQAEEFLGEKKEKVVEKKEQAEKVVKDEL